MKAIIFDIDGTLITSNYIDSKLYKEAIRDYFPTIKFKKDWSKYKNITIDEIPIFSADDSFIRTEIMLKARINIYLTSAPY